MKIKRYFAKDMRQAMRQVREAQGPDAVILSNRTVQGGVEVVAAVDFEEACLYRDPPAAVVPSAKIAPPPKAPKRDEGATRAPARAVPRPAAAPGPQLVWSQEPTLLAVRQELSSMRGLLQRQISGFAWGEQGRRHPVRTALLRRFLDLGISPRLSRQIVAEVAESGGYDGAGREGLRLLSSRLQVTGDDILSTGGVIALVGPTGVGKTTTVAKLAARFALRHGADRVALLTTDSYRVGAHEQLRTYARIMGIPMRFTRNGDELRQALGELRGRRLVLIDTAGMSQRDLRLSEQLTMLQRGAPEVRSYVVLSATNNIHALEETVRAFRRVPLAGSIITKVDEASTLGGVLSVTIQNALPVAYVSNGQRVPEDIEAAHSSSLILGAVKAMKRTAYQHDGESAEAAYGGLVASGII
jgi:flagellar biosynthesis protein FlhF